MTPSGRNYNCLQLFAGNTKSHNFFLFCFTGLQNWKLIDLLKTDFPLIMLKKKKFNCKNNQGLHLVKFKTLPVEISIDYFF